MQLKHLTKLHLGNKFGHFEIHDNSNDNVSGFTFYEGVAPILSATGTTLKKLVLEDFQQIDINLIGQMCPILEHLALSGTASFAPVLNTNQNTTTKINNESHRSFTTLKQLELWQNSLDSITEPMLRLLLCRGCPIIRLVFQRYIFLLHILIDFYLVLL